MTTCPAAVQPAGIGPAARPVPSVSVSASSTAVAASSTSTVSVYSSVSPTDTAVPLVGSTVLFTRITDDTSVSVAVLLPGVGSGAPPGGLVTVAVLVSSPVKSPGTAMVRVKVTVASAGRLIGTPAIAPLPLATPHVPPPVDPPQVQAAVVMPTGSGSSTIAPETPNGPRLLTTMV